MRGLRPYMWPEGRMDLKARVVIALLLLMLSKIVTVATPYAFKYATNALAPTGNPAAIAVTVALAMVLAYGTGRIFMVAFAQMRDAIFAKVGQRAVRQMATETFEHLHGLSLKFHLERRTGALSRVMSRGINGVDSVLRFALFNTVPTAFEIILVCVLLTISYGWLYSPTGPPNGAWRSGAP
jgi:ATP-binding cassette, subfamily B, heavy metal transporter